MLRRMVLSENSALVAILDFFHELLDIKYIQLERRRQFYNILGLPVSNGDAAKCKPGSRAESCCCIFAMSRKLNTTSLEHNCIPATCCCDDVCSVQELSGVESGRIQEVPTDILHHP
jgi:hypothetical protein